MDYERGDIIRIKDFRDRSLFEVVSKYNHVGIDLYYVTNDEGNSELLLPASLFTLVCRARNRADLKERD
mgnify:CR=1 FL=1